MRLGHEKNRRRDLARSARSNYPQRSKKQRRWMEEQARKEEMAMERHRKKPETVERLLHIWGAAFDAGATWRKDQNGWRCIKASNLIPWMVGLNPEQAKQALAQRPDWMFEWSKELCRGVSVRRSEE